MRITKYNNKIRFASSHRSISEFGILVLLSFGIQSLIPSSRAGFSTLTTWGDQSAILTTSKQVITSGQAPLMRNHWLGPGYIFFTRIFAKISSSVEVGLILLTLSSFILIFAFILFQLNQFKNRTLKYAGYLGTLLLYFTLRVYQYKDIPWTHFLEALIIILIITLGSNWNSTSPLKYGIFGFALFLSWNVRNFETAALLIAGIMGIFVRWQNMGFSAPWTAIRRTVTNCIKGGTLGVVMAWVAIGICTNSWSFFTQYSGMLPASDLSISRLADRIIQIFYNPSWHTISTPSVFVWNGVKSNLYSLGFGRTWFEPLVIGQPTLVPFLFISLFIAIRITFSTRKQKLVSQRILVSLICHLSSLGIFLGYMIQPIVGSGSLKYGLFREFLLPQLLSFFGLILFLQDLENRGKRINWLKASIFIPFLLAVTCLLIPKPKTSFYENYTLSLKTPLCNTLASKCEFQATILKEGRVMKLDSQPMEIRTSCGKAITQYWSKSFDFQPMKCIGIQKIYGVPLSFGIAATPEDSQFFEVNKPDWVTITS